MKTNAINWTKKSKIGSFDKIAHVPGGGNVTIPTNPLKWRQQSKVGSFDNIHHKPKGGDVIIETNPLKWNKTSKVGSLDNKQQKALKEQIKPDNVESISNPVEEERPKPESLNTSSYEDPSGYSAIFHEAKRHRHVKRNHKKLSLERWKPLPAIASKPKVDSNNTDENNGNKTINFKFEREMEKQKRIDVSGIVLKDLHSDTNNLHTDANDLQNDINDLQNDTNDLHDNTKDLQNDIKDLHNDTNDIQNDTKDLQN
ncbi:unnamed protein product, partial [Owenia fusiformis]